MSTSLLSGHEHSGHQREMERRETRRPRRNRRAISRPLVGFGSILPGNSGQFGAQFFQDTWVRRGFPPRVPSRSTVGRIQTRAVLHLHPGFHVTSLRGRRVIIVKIGLMTEESMPVVGPQNRVRPSSSRIHENDAAPWPPGVGIAQTYQSRLGLSAAFARLRNRDADPRCGLEPFLQCRIALVSGLGAFEV
jgi:hypothetical protein